MNMRLKTHYLYQNIWCLVKWVFHQMYRYTIFTMVWQLAGYKTYSNSFLYMYVIENILIHIFLKCHMMNQFSQCQIPPLIEFTTNWLSKKVIQIYQYNSISKKKKGKIRQVDKKSLISLLLDAVCTHAASYMHVYTCKSVKYVKYMYIHLKILFF